MRNRFAGTCYRCSQRVEPGDGHFERMGHKWRVQHATCAIECRGIRDPERLAHQMAKWERAGRGTGKSAQQARRRLRAALAEEGARTLAAASLPTIADPVKEEGR